MATATIDSKPRVRARIAELENQLAAVQEQLQSLRRSDGGLQEILPELHDAGSGRIDAQKLAGYLGVPLKQLADALELNYKSVHRNPAAAAGQAALQPVKRAVEILHEFFGKPQTVRVWLNTPHPDLAGRSALELILANKAVTVLRILENAVAGVPV